LELPGLPAGFGVRKKNRVGNPNTTKIGRITKIRKPHKEHGKRGITRNYKGKIREL
jgi:hypothetical protein